VYWTATVYPDALIEVGDSVTLYPGESYHVTAGTNCTSFSWFPYAGLSNPLISDPVATPEVSTMYVVTATTEHNCVTRDTLNVFVSEESLLAMPNAFTPGNGTNGTFRIILRGIASLSYFRVYNRWGNIMFETKNMSEGWDGAYKGEPQGMGVYTYDIQATSSSGKIFKKTGNVTLLR
jgi:gliding motility-associated-like protein